MAAGIALATAGCAVGPDYQRPPVQPLEEFPNADTTVVALSDSALADSTWWTAFGDTAMVSLVETSLVENSDVRLAAARVDEFMGLYRVVRSDLFPKIDASGFAERGESPFTVPGPDGRATTNLFEVDVGARWEIDLWGKIRRAKEAASAELLAAEYTRRGVALSVASLVATTYIDLLSLDSQLAIAERTAQSREESLRIMRERLDKGDASELEVSQVESEYWLAMSEIPFLEQLVLQTENALSVLVGRNPGPIARGGTIEDLALPEIPGGLPSELLERRPDVLAAEELLVSANAQIGVAKALYFPSISLTGLFGVSSGDLSDLFTRETRIWSVAGSAIQPIFRGGEIRGQVAAAEAFQRQAVEAYVSSVRNAFRDADDALAARGNTERQAFAEQKRVEALATYARLSRMRYDEGLTSYLEVLDAERALFDTELRYAQTQGSLLRSVIDVYRALAGGWVDTVAEMSYPPESPPETPEGG
jgi:multidrug efflux system outer membrane protein